MPDHVITVQPASGCQDPPHQDPPHQHVTRQFHRGLFGCLDNCGLCVLTFLLPCYTFGRNAEAVGDSCALCGLSFAVPVLSIVSRLMVRTKIRAAHRIKGGWLGDLCTIMWCPCCALVQEAQEVHGREEGEVHGASWQPMGGTGTGVVGGGGGEGGGERGANTGGEGGEGNSRVIKRPLDKNISIY